MILLRESRLVTIAAAYGGAYAGGAGLLAACDLVVATEDLKVGFPEIRRGLVPALVSAVLANKVRDGDLPELFLIGDPVSAHRAQQMGLVQRIVPAERLTAHARTRRQFGRTLGEFELVRQKLARMAAWTYAIEAMTTVTAGLIDRGLEDYMVETAMLKVYSTERLWTIVNDLFQIHGGAAYFDDKPIERMLRDARINQIGEGANEVLFSFVALAGMREPGLELKATWDALHQPLTAPGALVRFAGDFLRLRFTTPEIPVHAESLKPAAARVGRLIKRLGIVVQQTLMRHREEVLERQIEQERLAWAAMELFASVCVLSRRDAQLAGLIESETSSAAVATLFLQESVANAARQLAFTGHSPDHLLRDAATAVLNDMRV